MDAISKKQYMQPVLLLYSLISIIFSSCCISNQCLGKPIVATSTGQEQGDFTATYDVIRKYPYDGMTSQQIKALLIKNINNNLARYPGKVELNGHVVSRADEFPIDNAVSNIQKEFQAPNTARHFTLTISQNGSKILVMTSSPIRSQGYIWIFDGANTIFGYSDSYVNIQKGMRYEENRDFVFPGRSVGNIAMVRSLSPLSQPGHYTGAIALSRGSAILDGSPAYTSGWFNTDNFQGNEHITDLYSGINTSQNFTYSNYHNVGKNIVLPFNISLEERHLPAGIPPALVRCITTYKLINASANALPDSNFTFEGMFNRVASVTDTTRNPPVKIIHKPGKSLQDEISDYLALSLKTQSMNGHGNSGLYGMLAMIVGICAWYMYRRSATLSQRGNS